jgi:hypothetical protein
MYYLKKKTGQTQNAYAKYGNISENMSFLPIFGGSKKRLARKILSQNVTTRHLKNTVSL